MSVPGTQPSVCSWCLFQAADMTAWRQGKSAINPHHLTKWNTDRGWHFNITWWACHESMKGAFMTNSSSMDYSGLDRTASHNAIVTARCLFCQPLTCLELLSLCHYVSLSIFAFLSLYFLSLLFVFLLVIRLFSSLCFYLSVFCVQLSPNFKSIVCPCLYSMYVCPDISVAFYTHSVSLWFQFSSPVYACLAICLSVTLDLLSD